MSRDVLVEGFITFVYLTSRGHVSLLSRLFEKVVLIYCPLYLKRHFH